MAKVGVRKPLDEYQIAEKSGKAARERQSTDRMQKMRTGRGTGVMPVMTQAGSTVGQPVKMKSDNPAIKKKKKGYSSEMM